MTIGNRVAWSSHGAETEDEAIVTRLQSEPMKVFLRNTQTGWYYQEPSKWTPAQEEALDLAQVARAVELIFEAHLENVEILLSYDDPRYDLILPVPPSPSRDSSSGRRRSSDESRPGEKGRPAPPGHKGPRL